jgi:hypothetical protein
MGEYFNPLLLSPRPLTQKQWLLVILTSLVLDNISIVAAFLELQLITYTYQRQ